MTNIDGKNVKVWANEREGRNGAWTEYVVGISRKNQDGTFTNKYLRLMTGAKTNKPNEIPHGSFIDFKGWLTVIDNRRDAEGEPEIAIYATDIWLSDRKNQRTQSVPQNSMPDSFSEADDDIPF